MTDQDGWDSTKTTRNEGFDWRGRLLLLLELLCWFDVVWIWHFDDSVWDGEEVKRSNPGTKEEVEDQEDRLALFSFPKATFSRSTIFRQILSNVSQFVSGSLTSIYHLEAELDQPITVIMGHMLVRSHWNEIKKYKSCSYKFYCFSCVGFGLFADSCMERKNVGEMIQREEKWRKKKLKRNYKRLKPG